jgi:hypothetical protein
MLPQGSQAARRGARRGASEVRSPVAALPALDVQPMGARAGAATGAMRARMREHVARNLRVLVDGRVLTSPHGYLVDGSIDTLDVYVDVAADTLQISCSVRLILSARRSGAMLAMTTGQATLKNARRARGPAAEARLELEVLDGAVRAASDELVEHFEARRKT